MEPKSPNFGQDFDLPNLDDYSPTLFQDAQDPDNFANWSEEQDDPNDPDFEPPTPHLHDEFFGGSLERKDQPQATVTQSYVQRNDPFTINWTASITPAPQVVRERPRYEAPRMPPNFLNSAPPFDPPYSNAQYETFANLDQAKSMVAKVNNLNDSYIAIPAAFIRRLRDSPGYNPIYGYFIHH